VRVSVIVVGYGAEPGLRACLDALVADRAEGDEVVLVDNGVRDLPDVPGVTVVQSGENSGFGAGCALGVAHSSGDVLVFVNSDAVIRPGALASLTAQAAVPDVGLVTGCVLLAGTPDLVNAAGNPVHFLGISWSGGYGQPRVRHTTARDVASVSGALFAVRREVWERLGGMDPAYFLYHEDTDLSLRCHLAGLRVRYCPQAVAAHSYSFSKNPQKMYLLERNRLVTVLSDYPRGLLARVLPALVVTEPLLFAMAVRQGWAREKANAWRWVATNRRAVTNRRRIVQADTVVAWPTLASVLEPRIQPLHGGLPRGMQVLNSLLHAYWLLTLERRPPGVTS
jgi:GT2 family glycosyltransferase